VVFGQFNEFGVPLLGNVTCESMLHTAARLHLFRFVRGGEANGSSGRQRSGWRPADFYV
jgi:hypothetical protein